MVGPGAPPTAAPPDTGTFELVTVEARKGLEAVDILRLRTSVGPVLHDASGDTLGFLVPEGTSLDWDLPGSVCTVALAPCDRAGGPPVSNSQWLLPPHTTAPFTDPVLLRRALGEAAVTLEAADRM
ncbi:hypothetical protein AQ490_05355 [Wenjunlia vitaminophila]|uniref:Uncharacterized protein n=1 Tax=Wenjunlia vitaminophila TaxID=76728 RepID=A0A0T6LNW8_WENVI|nr:hypothetical protein AQ490_05355 [Wenjunlia vitaminophila]